MVLVKMLMEIDPLPMRGSMVMMMVMISPPGGMFPRQNSSAGALDWFRQGSASRRRCFVPKASFLFFPGRKISYSRRWASEACQVAHETGGASRGVGRSPHPGGQGVGLLWLILLPVFFYIFQNVKFQDFWSCAE